MLQGAAAAPAEMPARRPGAPGPGRQSGDHPSLAPAAAPHAEPRPHPIAGNGERQKDRLAGILRDPVTLRAESLDDEFGIR